MNSIESRKPLTQREREVMSYVAQGMTNPQIADILFITRHTVKAHVSSALYKLNVKSRFDAALIFLNIKKNFTE